MSKLKSVVIPCFAMVMILFVSCGKSYKSSENSIPVDIYLNGPMRLSDEEIEKNDTLAILLNLIDGRIPQLNFHRMDLGDSVFRDSIEMGFFNSLFVELIDVNDMEEDLKNKVFGSDLKAFLTARKGNNIKVLDSMRAYLSIDSILLNKDEAFRVILEKNFIKNVKVNNGRILISFLPSKPENIGTDSASVPLDDDAGPVDPEPFKDSDGDGIFDSKDKCPNVFGSKHDDGCPDSGGITISNGGTVSWLGGSKVMYLSIRFSTAPDKEVFHKDVENGDKLEIPGVQNTNDEQFYIIKYGTSKGNLGNEITVKCTNFL